MIWAADKRANKVLKWNWFSDDLREMRHKQTRMFAVQIFDLSVILHAGLFRAEILKY